MDRQNILDAIHEAMVLQKQENDDYRTLWLSWYSYVLKDHKAIFFGVPKCAYTSLKRLMYKIEGRNLPQDVHNVSSNRNIFKFFSGPEPATDALSDPSWFKFAFVRNPYSRLLSAYKDKIAKDIQEEKFVPIVKAIKLEFGLPDNATIPFSIFVTWVTSQDGPHNSHWDKQTRVLRTDVVPYSFFGKTERIDKDIQIVFGRLGIKPISIEKSNETGTSKLAFQYNRETADLVYWYYREDFDSFGYFQDSWLYE